MCKIEAAYDKAARLFAAAARLRREGAFDRAADVETRAACLEAAAYRNARRAQKREGGAV